MDNGSGMQYVRYATKSMECTSMEQVMLETKKEDTVPKQGRIRSCNTV
jgi:hypothetical protein